MADDDILSQDDIDALMEEAVSSAESQVTIFNHEGNRFDPQADVSIATCDFRNPMYMTDSQLRLIRLRHESFIHYLGARLSMFIRMDMTLKMSRLHTMTYEDFTMSIPSPIFISIFRIQPLNGVGIISINPRLAMTLVNRMLGGKGHSVTDERYLTDIEMALMEDAVKVVMDEWSNQWPEVEGLKPDVVGRENNGRFLQTATRDAIMLVLDIEGTLGDCTEQIQLGIPYYMMEPILRKLQESNEELSKAERPEKQRRWLPAYSDINVEMTAEWDAFEISVSDVLRLRPGDVLEMPKDIISRTLLRVEGATCFQGEAGIEGNHVAVKVTDKFNQKD